MVVSLQTRMRIVFVAFIIVGLSLLEVDAFVYPLAIDKLNEPLFKKQHSINGGGSNESVVSGEVINHVRHQHEQTIGNVHILTNIDIANLITILNVSAPAPTTAVAGQSTDATTQPGKCLRKNAISLIMILSAEITVAAEWMFVCRLIWSGLYQTGWLI